MDFAADLEAFAERQGKTQQEQESVLFGSAKAALRRWGQEDWYRTLLARATSILRHRYRQETSTRTSPALREFVDGYEAAMAKWLEKTKEPTPETLEAQARSIAATLSTAAVNAALEAAAEDDDTPNSELEKVWLSREDDKVRPTHAAAHGQAVPMGERFTVGEAKMKRPGDTTAPIDEVINCRCLMAVRKVAQPDAVTAAAGADMTHDGALIVMLPAEDDPVHDLSSEDDAHITTVWFGAGEEAADLDIDALAEATAALAAGMQPTSSDVKNRGLLGDDDADVLFLDGDPLIPLRDLLLDNEVIAAAHDAVKQFPEWTPHVTLGYPETPAAEGDAPAAIRFDRLALWVGDDHSRIYPMGADMADDTTTEEQVDDALPEPLAEGDRIGFDGDRIPFWGVMAPEGKRSGDMRQFSAGALRTRPLPLPLSWQESNEGGHDSSIVVADIERMWRRNGLVYGYGHFLSTVEAGDKVVGMMAERGSFGVSIDADDGQMTLMMKDGRTVEEAMEALEPADEDGMGGDSLDFDDIVTEFTSARICGATVVHIPAFAEAFVQLGEVPEEFAPADGEDLVCMSLEELEAEGTSLAAAGGVKTEDGPGWITHPVDTERLRRYWTKGEGAAKIAWGTPGDFNRCRVNLAPYVKPQHLNGYCANRHYDALGFWPGRPLAGDVLTAAASAKEAPEGATMAPAISLVAAATPPAVPPREWFEDPHLTQLSHFTITDEGRVFGHVAAWGTCHIGFDGICTEPPQSATDYAYFCNKQTETDGGMVYTGVITLGTGHADLSKSATQAAAHYDNTSAAVVDVVLGEDEFGIWCAGAVRPTATPEQIKTLRGADVSGDWRTTRDGLELLAVLAVNCNGFPIPRPALAASAGKQTALVAAGIVRQPPAPISEANIKDIVRAALEEDRARTELERIAQERAAREFATLKSTLGRN